MVFFWLNHIKLIPKAMLHVMQYTAACFAFEAAAETFAMSKSVHAEHALIHERDSITQDNTLEIFRRLSL